MGGRIFSGDARMENFRTHEYQRVGIRYSHLVVWCGVVAGFAYRPACWLGEGYQEGSHGRPGYCRGDLWMEHY